MMSKTTMGMIGECEDEILDLVDTGAAYTRSDLQARAGAIVTHILAAGDTRMSGLTEEGSRVGAAVREQLAVYIRELFEDTLDHDEVADAHLSDAEMERVFAAFNAAIRE